MFRTPAAATLAALLLGGCASGDSLVEVLAGDRVEGDAERVLVRGFADVASATPLAVAHCHRFKRSAQYEARAAGAIRFRCVE